MRRYGVAVAWLARDYVSSGPNPEIPFDPTDQERLANDCAVRYEAAGIPVDCGGYRRGL